MLKIKIRNVVNFFDNKNIIMQDIFSKIRVNFQDGT